MLAGCYVGAGTDSAAPGSPAGPLPVLECGPLEPHAGEGTWYDADGTGACGFEAPAADEPLLIAALNAPDWDGSSSCGACAEVRGPKGNRITVKIVDLCPECREGDLDLSPEAFVQLAPLIDGRIPISWQIVPCEPEGPMQWHFSGGTNPWWLAVQVRNSRHLITGVQVLHNGEWRALPRADWNHFIGEDLGSGPFALRAFDIHGAMIEDPAVPLLDGAGVEGPGQFPVCEEPQ